MCPSMTKRLGVKGAAIRSPGGYNLVLNERATIVVCPWPRVMEKVRVRFAKKSQGTRAAWVTSPPCISQMTLSHDPAITLSLPSSASFCFTALACHYSHQNISSMGAGILFCSCCYFLQCLESVQHTGDAHIFLKYMNWIFITGLFLLHNTCSMQHIKMSQPRALCSKSL